MKNNLLIWIFAVLILVAMPIHASFVSEWKTTTTNQNIHLPLISSGTYDFNITWGDGTLIEHVTSYNSANATHTYAVAGFYNVTITGTITGFEFNNAGNKNEIYWVHNWSNLRFTNTGNYFNGCSHLNIDANDSMNLTGLNSLTNTFYNSDLTIFRNADKIDTSSIVLFNNLFAYSNFNSNISNWDTHNAQQLAGVFASTPFNYSINDWDISHVWTFYGMFENAPYNYALDKWTQFSTSHDVYLTNMFKNSKFNQPIQTWDFSHVSELAGMFQNNKKFNQNLSDIDVSHCSNFYRMFDSSNFNNEVWNWNLTGATKTYYMFYNAYYFDDNSISSWDMSTIQDMSYMFEGVHEYTTLNLHDWNVKSVTNTEYMFYGILQLHENLTTWNTSKLKNARYMFRGIVQQTWIDVSTWDTHNLQDTTQMFVGNYFLNNPQFNDWNTTNLKHVDSMFSSSNLKSRLDNWDIHNLTTATYFIWTGNYPTENYNLLLINWSRQDVKTGVTIKIGSQVSSLLANESKYYLINNKSWVIEDSGYKYTLTFAFNNLNSSWLTIGNHKRFGYCEHNNDDNLVIMTNTTLMQPLIYSNGSVIVTLNTTDIFNNVSWVINCSDSHNSAEFVFNNPFDLQRPNSTNNQGYSYANNSIMKINLTDNYKLHSFKIQCDDGFNFSIVLDNSTYNFTRAISINQSCRYNFTDTASNFKSLAYNYSFLIHATNTTNSTTSNTISTNSCPQTLTMALMFVLVYGLAVWLILIGFGYFGYQNSVFGIIGSVVWLFASFAVTGCNMMIGYALVLGGVTWLAIFSINIWKFKV